MATSYPFNNNVPQANQLIRVTQGPIESNFLAINSWVSQDHVGFNDSTNFGKHNMTTFPMQSVDPSTGSTDIALYSKASSSANGIELFYRYPNNGSVYQLTGGGSTGSSASSTNGYSYLTTTLLLKWGIATVATTGTTVVTYPTSGGIPAFTTSVYIVNFTPAANYTQGSNGAYITNQTTTTFTFNAPSTGMSSTIYWYAIGV